VTYLDVTAAGNLPAALDQAARAAGLDLGGPVASSSAGTASVAADRGDVHVRFDDQERRFHVSIYNDQHTWTAGVTSDLTEVARLADHWRRGTPLRELTAEFPFLEHTPLAQAYEDGNVREVRWDLLLQEAAVTRIGPFLQEAHRQPQLAAMYPYVTHGIRVLFLLEELDKSPGVLEVVATDDGGYRVSSTWNRTPQSATSVTEAVSAALGALPPTPSAV
jgi:hypothetical protein